MRCTPKELALKQRFETFYDRSQTPVMLAIERRVCGCDYGGNSWTTREEADAMAAHLRLGPGARLLELGAGSGWPAVYFAGRHDCSATLVDLPANGLRLAEERAARDGVAGRVDTLVADAADLPFPEQSFDAISHCDLLCCLERKREVLEGARRVIRPEGRMAFTVISIAPGLSRADYARALENGPDFMESGADYAAMLAAAGWSLTSREDLTQAYARSCERQIQADEAHAGELSKLLGPVDFVARLTGWREKLETIRLGLFRRELFVAAPAEA